MARHPRTPPDRPSPPPPPQPSGHPFDWRRHAVPVLILWAMALAAYANSFRGGLVFDNYFAIGKDPRIRQSTAANIHLILTQDYWYTTSSTSLYRPLTTFSYLFNYALLGEGQSPAGYHWVNFALHAANIALVYLLGLLLFAEFWPAVALAAVWAVHPILTESVTNIVGRADLLAGFGILAGLLAYSRVVAPRGRRALAWLLALAAVTAIAAFSKESGVAVLAVIALYDVAYCRKAPLRLRLAGYTAAALPIAVFLIVRRGVLAGIPAALVGYTDNPLVGADFWTARITAIKVIGLYLWRLLWPAHLSCDYSYGQIPLFGWSLRSGEDWKAILALLFCAAASVAAGLAYRRARPVFFCIAFFFVTLAPTANLLLLIGTIMAERLLYLPSIGFIGCLVWAAWTAYRYALPRWPVARVIAAAALVLVCAAAGARTLVRNADWFDEKSLWTSAAVECPNSYKAHQHLAVLAAGSGVGPLDEARAQIEQSVAILQPLPYADKPATVYTTAGACYRAKGDFVGPAGGAAAWYQKSLAALLEGQKADQAWYRDMAARNAAEGKTVAVTGWSPLYLELGKTYRALGQIPQALASFQYGMTINPQASFFEELAATYRAAGDPARAAGALLEGVTVDAADQTRLAAGLVRLYQETAPQSCALAGGGLNLNCPLVHDALCAGGRDAAILYRRMGRDQDALATAASAVRSLGCPAEMFR